MSSVPNLDQSGQSFQAATLPGQGQGTVDASAAPPMHRVHASNDPLPGARGGVAPTGYPTGTPRSEHPQPPRMDSESGSQGKNAFNEERPLNVEPAPEGGVAVDGRSGLPEGKANAMDKLVGKTQKVTGKLTKNWDMHERGELRETGGKNAAQGEARAAHD